MQRNKGRKLAHLLHVDLRLISDYTESPPAFAGNHKEHDHGQGKGIQQGSQETTGKDPEGEKGRKTGQETRIGRRSDDSPLILIRRDWFGARISEYQASVRRESTSLQIRNLPPPGLQ